MAVKPAEALRHLGLIDDKSEGRAACEDQPVPPRKAQLVEELPVRARPDPSLLAPGGTRGQHVGRSVDAIHIYPRLQQRRQEAPRAAHRLENRLAARTNMAHVIGQCFPWRLRLVEVISLSQQRLILGSSYPSTPSHLTLTSYVQPRTSRLLPLTSYFSRHIHRLTFLDRLLHDNLAYPHRVRRQRVRREQHEVRQLPNLDRPLSLLFEKLPRRVDRDGADGLAGCHSLLRSELAPAGRYAVHRRPDNRQDIRRRHGRVMMQRDRDSPVESRAHRVDARRALRPQEHVPVPVAPVVYVARKERYVQPEVPHVV